MDAIGMTSGSIDSLAASAEDANKKGTFTFPVNVPERAGEGIRTPDVQLGKTRVGNWDVTPKVPMA